MKSLIFSFLTISIILTAEVSISAQPGRIILDEGYLSVSARETPLSDLLDILTAKEDIEVEVQGNVDYPVTIEMGPTPIEEGLKQLLKPSSFSVIYEKSPSSEDLLVVKKISIYNARKNEQKSQGRTGVAGFKGFSGRGTLPVAGGQKSVVSRPSYQADILSLEEYAKQLDDPDPDVREDAIIDMADEYEESALVHLEKALVEDGNDEVKIAAAEAIGELESEKGISSLEKGLDDTDEDVREAVIAALGEIGGVKALPALKKALQDRNEDLREEALYWIEDIEESQ